MAGIEENIKDRRSRTASLINNMLVERKQLLTLLLEVSNLTTDEDADINFDLLDEFCQVLVDYIAAGHFGLYERLTEGTERRKKVAEMAANMFPRIESSTEIAVAFNEKYDAEHKTELKNLQKDLSLLGEELTTRIELEDRLIEQLL